MASVSGEERERKRPQERKKESDKKHASPGKSSGKESVLPKKTREKEIPSLEKEPEREHALSEEESEKEHVSPRKSSEKEHVFLKENGLQEKEPERVNASPKKEPEKQNGSAEGAWGKENVSPDDGLDKEHVMPEKIPTASDSAPTSSDAKKLDLLPAVKYLLKELDLEHVDLNNISQIVEPEHYSYPDIMETSEKPLYSTAEVSGENTALSTENVCISSGRSVLMLKESHSVGANLDRYDQIHEDKGLKKTDEPEKALVFRTEVEEEKAVSTFKNPPNIETNIGNLDQNTSPGSRTSGHQVTGAESASLMDEAWDRLQKSYVFFRGKPVGTLAAMDPSTEPLNYNQVSLCCYIICLHVCASYMFLLLLLLYGL